MELVGEDGSVIGLKERQRQELGRAAGKPAATCSSELDASVSRRHVILELLWPTSRKGKEVVGERPALKLYLQVIGRNPICIIRKEPNGKNSERVDIVRRGENDWLDLGDKFTLSIKKPSFLTLRHCSGGSVGPYGGEESLSALRNASPLVTESGQLDDEEQGIAEAVARRQRRKQKRDAENQRIEAEKKEQESETARDGEKCDTTNRDSDNTKEASEGPPNESGGALQSFDPVLDFGFVKEGSEFRLYEKHRHFKNSSDWAWNIDKRGRAEEGLSERSSSEGTENPPTGSTVRGKRRHLGEDANDGDWGGDSKEEGDRVAEVAEKAPKRKVLTRSSKSNKPTPNSSNGQTRLRKGLGKSRKQKTQDSGDLSDFVVSEDSIEDDGNEDDDDSFEEYDDEDEDEDEDDDGDVDVDEDKDDLMEDDEPAARQTKQTPACKYGSNCYRKNKEHREQFSHPSR